MMTEQKLELRYSHNIIEHLGLKLYQNRYCNVLAELISNAWDADASHVWIDIAKDHLALSDDGCGMSRAELSENYLVIGKKKRSSNNLAELTAKGRKMMGRKGIGKLAPFGIAQKLSLITVSKLTCKCHWLEIDLGALMSDQVTSDTDGINFSYEPKVICEDVFIDNIPLGLENDKHGCVARFISRIKSTSKTGTLIIMDNLSLKRSINADQLIKSIGQRFTVRLLREDFCVFIDDKKVSEEEALPVFTIRYPSEGYDEETVNINGNPRYIKYWVGFIEKADWPQDQAGVGVYTHEKIAQDRPFVFGLKGSEITTRYMYGVIEADWLDELGEDIVSTDRTSINWDNDETEDMYKWGHQLVKTWVNKYKRHQKDVNKDKIRLKLQLPELPKITDIEKETIADMVSKMSPRVYQDEELQNEVILNLTSAWTHRPTRNIIKSLWDKIELSESNEHEFVAILADIHKHLVPESLSLSVTVAQKIYALTRLNELSVNGTEPQLQALLETFPWILGSDKGKVYANQTLKESAKQASSENRLPSHGATAKELAQQPDSGTRPDFAFFSDGNESLIYVVEIKSPAIPLEYKHLSQLQTYFNWLKEHYPSAKITGYLIGKNPGDAVTSNDPDLNIMTWEQLCLMSRKDYLELLAAMLHGVSEHYDDARVNDVINFGGEPTRELLARMSDADSSLSNFLRTTNKKLEHKK